MPEIPKKYHLNQNTNTILEHFEFYDMRQENYERNMQMNKNKEMKGNETGTDKNNTNEKKDN